jgi:hypothetical protein
VKIYIFILRKWVNFIDYLLSDPDFWTSEINELVDLRNRLNVELHKAGVYEF